MKPFAVHIIWGFAFLLAYSSAKGDTIVSTFGPGDSYNPCCGFGNVWPAEIAYPFIIGSSSDFLFTSAMLALAEGIGPTNAVDISLAADVSDRPGPVLETFHLVDALGPAGAANPPVVVDSVLQPLLLAGSQYWLIESPSAPGNGVEWATANIAPDPAERAVSDDSGSSWSTTPIGGSDGPGAFSIFGTAVSHSVPEIDPAAGMSALALLSGALLVIRGRRMTSRG